MRKKKWYKPKINTNIYATGLPQDIKEEEVVEFFSKAGIIRLDFYTGEKRIKIYKDQDGGTKGDVLVSYQRPESVELALEILDQ